jgi:kynurenine formamidase
MPMPDAFTALAEKVRNWGRWGADDELGTLNLITDDKVRQAAACVRTGRRFSLAVDLRIDGLQTGVIPGRINPVRTMLQINHAMTGDPSQVCTNDDVVTMGLQAGTHWDALSHVSYDGRIWNGYAADTITAAGAARCGIDKVRTLVSRGVLLDVARATGVDQLVGGHAIQSEELDAAAALGQVTVEPGDVVLVRTGQMRHLHRGDKFKYMHPTAGLSMATVAWFREHDVAAVATDNLAFEVFPGERDDCLLPVHLLHLVEMGMTQGQNWDLETLADDCAADGAYTFLLDASPQPFVGGVGSPVNPVAIK